MVEEQKKNRSIGMPIMLIGFITAAIGGLFLVNESMASQPWVKPIVVSGFVLYVIGRILHANRR